MDSTLLLLHSRRSDPCSPRYILGASSGIVAYLLPAQRTLWTVAAVTTLSQLPWTGLAASSVEQEKASREEVVDLLKKWRWMNIVRGLLALTGGLIAVLALQSE
ncbi:hypothetical protein FLAG1_11471 [Fusarium langsethiae]|uniref:Uncharacterized protein n=1 Tax=Fusarium langsethiae TaxID=179993 RepID=A0A0N0V4P7_FUSLA|nr:hypothetical protein FLAG1_11471 [Fusarium langsethiae]GKU13037.1 unnamed protein product [Fusarium langsethiae]GKU15325.1 unnamed protein product [Fusarium langsethiae]